MSFSPNLAFTLLIVGLLGIYVEFIYPGRILPGIAGAIAALAGAHWLWRNSPSSTGALLLALSAPLFAIEALRGTRLICGVLASGSFIAGSWTLFGTGSGFSLPLALALSLPFSALTLLLAHTADRARRNKHSTL